MRSRNGTLFIGQVAVETGLTRDAVRYYERLGLLPRPARTAGRFRVYTRDAIARLRFIKQAQRFGLELREIRSLLAPADGRRREQCERVKGIVAKHLAEVDARLDELGRFRETLAAALDACTQALQRKEHIGCPVINQLGSHES